ncbi:MAG TPA: LysM domain-containing protein [Candidatus Limnocylindrales bacterium]
MEEGGGRYPPLEGSDPTTLEAAEADDRFAADGDVGTVVEQVGLRRVPPVARARSPHPTTCPFFRSLGPDAVLGPPLEAPDPVNRCAAAGEIKPQSYRQQELVCLTSGHVNCPRYLRGTVVTRRGPMARPIPMRTIGRATGAATLVLAGALVVSVGFLLARGGFTLPTRSPSATLAAVASPTLSASPVAPTTTPPPAASPTASPSIASPSVSVSPSPSLPETPAETAGSTPRSDRYALLDPCPDAPRCWIYTIRRGDNLFSIARYFGVPLETVRRLNPWTRHGIRAGQELILPPPTR